jgi:hypothetical protein
MGDVLLLSFNVLPGRAAAAVRGAAGAAKVGKK